MTDERPKFRIQKGGSSKILDIEGGDICYVGKSIDQRGRSALDAFSDNSVELVEAGYDPIEMSFHLNGVVFDADQLATNLVLPRSRERACVLEASTLGFPEIYLILEAALALGHRKFIFSYVEPGGYEKSDDEWAEFDLSEEILGFLPIPRAVINLSSSDVARGVFFVGYEAARLDRAFEDLQMISTTSSTVVFGLPAYSPGWELNAIVPHLEILETRGLRDFQFCAADNPSAAYDLIVDIIKALGSDERMFVAPIGPKPFGIGAALAAAMFPGRVGVIYDHPRRKEGRSKGVGAWHSYFVDLGSYGDN